MKKHDVRGPSSLARLSLCPGSANLIEAHPEIEDAGSDASARGDRMHEAMSALMKGAEKVYAKAIELGLGPADIDDLSFAVGKATELYESVAPDFMAVEEELDLSSLGISIGTADLLLVSPWQSAHVVDYKFGRYPVSPAARNMQLAAYACGVADAHNVAEITVHIVQPSLGVHSSHKYTDLYAVRRMVQSVLDQSRDPDAPRIPGDEQCKFCRVAGVCSEAGARVDEVISLAPVPELSLAQLEAAMDKVAVVRAVVGKIEEAMYQHLIMGGRSEKWALSKPRSLRSWKESLAGIEELGLPAEAWSHSLKSPAQVEKLVGKDLYKQIEKRYIEKKNSKPSLVPAKAGGKGKENGDQHGQGQATSAGAGQDPGTEAGGAPALLGSAGS